MEDIWEVLQKEIDESKKERLSITEKDETKEKNTKI